MGSGVFISEAGKITYTLHGYYHIRRREVYPIDAIRYTIHLRMDNIPDGSGLL